MSSFVITDVRIFTGDVVIPFGSVLVKDGIIEYVGTELPQTEYSTVYKKPGHTLLPGFIDAHVHAHDERALGDSLRFGATTIMDMGNALNIIAPLRKLAVEKFDVSDLKSCIQPATVDGGWPRPIIREHDKSPETAAMLESWPKLNNSADVNEYMRQCVADGADYIKLMQESGKALGVNYPHPTQELQAMIISAAHANGLKAVAHATCIDDTLKVLHAGVDGLAHTFFDQSPTKEVIEAYKKNNAWCCPTLVAVGSMTTEGQALSEKFAHDPRVASKLSKHAQESLCQCMNRHAKDSSFKYAVESVRIMKESGVDVIVGSDTAGPAVGTAYGVSIHEEMYLFVHECGFTPVEALHAATALTAKRFGWDDRGLIAAGKRADLVLIEGDVTTDINRSLDLRVVWKAGVMTDLTGEA